MRNSISFFRVKCHLFRNPVEMETKIECLFCTFFLYSVIIAEENENLSLIHIFLGRIIKVVLQVLTYLTSVPVSFTFPNPVRLFEEYLILYWVAGTTCPFTIKETFGLIAFPEA